MVGTDRQPSSQTIISSLAQVISGLMSTRGALRSSLVSITTTRSCTSTWVAAKPTPLASYMVSSMSSTNWRMRSSTIATGLATVCRRGSGYWRMGSRAMAETDVDKKLWMDRNDAGRQSRGPSGNPGQFSLRQRGISGQNQAIIDQILPKLGYPCTENALRQVIGDCFHDPAIAVPRARKNVACCARPPSLEPDALDRTGSDDRRGAGAGLPQLPDHAATKGHGPEGVPGGRAAVRVVSHSARLLHRQAWRHAVGHFVHVPQVALALAGTVGHESAANPQSPPDFPWPVSVSGQEQWPRPSARGPAGGRRHETLAACA